MTTSLPANCSLEMPSGAPALAGAAPLNDALAALFAAATPTPATTPTGVAAPADFAAVLDNKDFVSPAAIAPATPLAPAAPTASTTPPSLVEAAPSPVLASACGSRTAPVSSRTLGQSFASRDARAMEFSPDETISVVVETDVAPTVQETPAPVSPAVALPDRSTLEAALALLAPVAQMISPQPLPTTPEPSATEAPLDDAAASIATPIGEVPEATTRPVPLAITLSQPGHAPISFPVVATTADIETHAPILELSEPQREISVAPSTSDSVQVSAPTTLPRQPMAAPESALPKASLLPDSPVMAREGEIPAPAAQLPAPTMELTASVELADGSTLAISLPTTPRPTNVEPSAEKNAAPLLEKIVANFSSEIADGKNFLTLDSKQLTPAREKAGIAVAQTRPIMFFAPHDSLPAVHPTVPALVSVAPAAFDAGAASPEPMPTLVAASLARRAVETVSSVVDAQAVSKLQPVPSVQLKFKFGADDLAVRVELCGGLVHTEFRTDSPELRSAIESEWKALAAQPENAGRFLEAVVTPASSSGGNTNSFAQHHQQSGQSAAQQQQQQQQSRAAAEFFGSVGRSTPFQPRDGGAATPAPAPVVLPTSLHLSAVA